MALRAVTAVVSMACQEVQLPTRMALDGDASRLDLQQANERVARSQASLAAAPVVVTVASLRPKRREVDGEIEQEEEAEGVDLHPMLSGPIASFTRSSCLYHTSNQYHACNHQYHAPNLSKRRSLGNLAGLSFHLVRSVNAYNT